VASVSNSLVVFMSETHVYSASKFMIDTGAGVVDADYRGILFVLLFNHSDVDFTG
jgi:dUTPase